MSLNSRHSRTQKTGRFIFIPFSHTAKCSEIPTSVTALINSLNHVAFMSLVNDEVGILLAYKSAAFWISIGNSAPVPQCFDDLFEHPPLALPAMMVTANDPILTCILLMEKISKLNFTGAFSHDRICSDMQESGDQVFRNSIRVEIFLKYILPVIEYDGEMTDDILQSFLPQFDFEPIQLLLHKSIGSAPTGFFEYLQQSKIYFQLSSYLTGISSSIFKISKVMSDYISLLW